MKTLVLDIETLPLEAYVWGLWDVNIPINMIKEPGQVVCFASKWVGTKSTQFHRGPDVIQTAWELLDAADVVIHYNGKKFDVPHLNTEFVLAGLGPPSPFKHIDLCNVVKRQFKFPSNKLQYVSTALGLPGKVDTGGFELWKGIMANDEKWWAKMEKYNIQDVRITEKLYQRILPWIPDHPNLRLFNANWVCPTCGGPRLQKRGFAYTKVSKFQQYQCLSCNSYFRDSRRINGVTLQESVR